MRSLITVLGGAAALLVATSSCGSSATSSNSDNVLTGLAAKDIIKAAADKTPATSLRFDLEGKLAVDTSRLSGIPTDQLGALGALASGATLSGSGEQESAQRQKLTLTVKPIVAEAITAVLYDGHAYYSLDGKVFGSVGSLKSLTNGIGITPKDLSGYLGSLGDNVKDLGQETRDNVATEHLRATLDAGFLTKALGSASGTSASQNSQLLQLFSQLITLRTGSLDTWVRQSDGRLDRATVDFSVDFDLGKLGAIFGGAAGGTPSANLPKGVLTLSLNLTSHLFDYGASIHITRPTVDPNAPKLPSGLGGTGLFG